jgi:hypothetical protein
VCMALVWILTDQNNSTKTFGCKEENLTMTWALGGMRRIGRCNNGTELFLKRELVTHESFLNLS